MEKITILIVEDHTLLRETWSCIFNNDPTFSVIALCGTAEEAIELVKNHKPDVVILDINLPRMSGLYVTPELRKISPNSKIIGVSMHTQPAYARQMIKRGALGYVTKNSSREEMICAVKEVATGKKYICKEIRDNLTQQVIHGDKDPTAQIDSLSEREIQIIGFIKKGFSSKEIASALFISVKTVEVHRFNMLKKLNLKNAAALVNFINRHYSGIDL